MWWVYQGKIIFVYQSYYLVLNHIDTNAILPRYEGPCMVHILEWYQKQKYYEIHVPKCYQNMLHLHYRHPNGIK